MYNKQKQKNIQQHSCLFVVKYLLKILQTADKHLWTTQAKLKTLQALAHSTTIVNLNTALV